MKVKTLINAQALLNNIEELERFLDILDTKNGCHIVVHKSLAGHPIGIALDAQSAKVIFNVIDKMRRKYQEEFDKL